MTHWRGGRLTTGHHQPSAYSADTRTDTNIIQFKGADAIVPDASWQTSEGFDPPLFIPPFKRGNVSQALLDVLALGFLVFLVGLVVAASIFAIGVLIFFAW